MALRSIDYLIYLTDPIALPRLQRTYNDTGGLAMAPLYAAEVFGAPIGGQSPNTSAIIPPITLYQWLDGINLTPYIASMSFKIPNLDGTDPGTTTWTWRGFFLMWDGVVGNPSYGSVILPVLGQRLWVDGFEMASIVGGEGATSMWRWISKAASRVVGGHGMALRGDTSAIGRSHNQGTSGSPAKLTDPHWERFYLRLLAYPTGLALLHTMHGINGSEGATLQITTTGVLQGYNKPNLDAAPGTLIGQSQGSLTLGQWYRVDMRIKFFPLNGQLDLYLNGRLQFSAIVLTNGGLGVSGNTGWQYSTLGGETGNMGTSLNRGLFADVDDWIGTLEPIQNGNGVPGLDLTAGSHVILVRPTGFATDDDTAAYTGNWRSLTANPLDGSLTTSVNTSSTALATRRLTTDYRDQQMGCPAFTVAVYKPTGTTLGRLGWRVAGGSDVLQVPSLIGATWLYVTYSLGNGFPYPPLPQLGTLDIIHEKSNDAIAQGIQFAGIAAEMLGVFGPEDTTETLTFLPDTGQHNSPFPDAYPQDQFNPPVGIVTISSGTYTGGGNPAGQDVLTGQPANWLWIRRTSGAALAGTLWYSSMETAHRPEANLTVGDLLPRVLIDPADGLSKFYVAGAETSLNESGSTYQWVAVSDVAMRFMLNHCASERADTVTRTQSLWRTQFLPDYGFFVREDSVTGTVNRTYVKGPAHTGQDASPLAATNATGIVSFAQGVITLQSTLCWDQPQAAYSLWRLVAGDGSGGACSARGLFDVVTYVGDGAGGTRAIPVALNGRSPLFCLATPMNTFSYLRDPGHTGTNSSTVAGGNATTALVGGDLNSVTVGTTLNAAGITYTLFVLPGNAVPGGWSTNLAVPFSPVPADVCYADCWGPDCPDGPYDPTDGSGSGCSSNLEPTPTSGGTGCSGNLEPAVAGSGAGCSQELP